MSTARTHVRNLAANWFAHGANISVLLVLSPFVVGTLGQLEYGIWSLLNVLTGHLSLLDLGIRASTGRHVILYVGKGDHRAVNQTIRTGLGLYGLLGLVTLAAGIALGWIFPSMFSSVPAGYHDLLKLLMPLMAVNIMLTAFSVIYASVLQAHDRFDLARLVDLGVLAARTAGVVVALMLGYGLVGLVAATIAAHALALVGNWIIARKVYPHLRSWPPALNAGRLRELVGFGTAAVISTVALRIIGQTDLLVVGAALGVSAVTIYSVGAMLVYYSTNWTRQIATVLFPSVQRAAARGEIGEVRWLFFRQVRLAIIISLPMYIGFLVFSEPFIRLWMLERGLDESGVRQAALVMSLLAGAKLALLTSFGAGRILTATGYVWLNAGLAVSEAAVNLGLSLLFVLGFGWGLAGVAMGTIAGRVAVKTFLQPWCACRVIGIRYRRFLARIGGTAAAAGTLLAGWSLAVRSLIRAESWLLFAGQVVLALAVYVPIAMWLLVPAEDRRRLWQRLRVGTAAQKV